MKLLSATAAAGLIAAALLAAGQAQADPALDRLYQEAKAEGKVSVAGPPNATLRQELSAVFTKRFPGIEVEFFGGRGSEVANKMKSEIRAGLHSVDVVINGTTTSFLLLKPDGLLRPFEDMIVSEEARDPTKWRDGRLGWADKEKTTLAMLEIVANVVTVNTDLVKPGEITSDADLLNPKWKGKIVMNDPEAPGNANVTARRWFELHGKGYYDKLKAQNPVVIKDLRQAADFVAKGRYAIGIAVSPQVTSQLIEQGVKNLDSSDNMRWKDKMVLSAGFGGLMVPKVQAHPKASQLMVNWLLTKEGQDLLVRALAYPSRRLDADLTPVADYLQQVNGVSYYEGYSEEYIRSPVSGQVRAALKEVKFGR